MGGRGPFSGHVAVNLPSLKWVPLCWWNFQNAVDIHGSVVIGRGVLELMGSLLELMGSLLEMLGTPLVSKSELGGGREDG